MIGVITGDIVRSTALSQSGYKRMVKELRDQCEILQQHFDVKWELYRGDGFQVSVLTPEKTMLCAALLKTGLMRHSFEGEMLDTTLSIALGEQTVASDALGTSFGSAYVLSGRGLDKANRGELALKIDDNYKQLAASLTMPTRFFDHFLRELSQKQAKILYYCFDMSFPEHQLIAEKVATSRQNVSKHLNKLGADLIKEYLQFFEEQTLEAISNGTIN